MYADGMVYAVWFGRQHVDTRRWRTCPATGTLFNNNSHNDNNYNDHGDDDDDDDNNIHGDADDTETMTETKTETETDTETDVRAKRKCMLKRGLDFTNMRHWSLHLGLRQIGLLGALKPRCC